MGKSTYLKNFQKNLRNCIEDLVHNEWGKFDWLITEEDGEMPGRGRFKGYMDISIYDQSREKNVLAIEIEHKSSYVQAKQNIKKLKEWTHNSPERALSLLHIFNEESNIDSKDVKKLVSFAKENERKNHGFYYDFIFYSVNDFRMTKHAAESLAASIDFQTRLWMLMENCGFDLKNK